MDMKRANEMSGWTDEQWWGWAAEAFMPTNIRMDLERYAGTQDAVTKTDDALQFAWDQLRPWPWSSTRIIINGVKSDMLMMGITPWAHHIIHTPEFALAACVGPWAVCAYVRSLLGALVTTILDDNPDDPIIKERMRRCIKEADNESERITDLLIASFKDAGFTIPLQLACPDRPAWVKKYEQSLAEFHTEHANQCCS